MRLETHAIVTINRERGEREMKVHDLSYNEETQMFTFVYTRKYHAVTREYFVGYRSWDGKQEE